jgi:phytoene dehydrogenase-like protein
MGKVPFQVILPEARIDPTDNTSLLQTEWRREFPGELALIEQFYGELELLQDRLKVRARKEASSYFPVDTRSVLRKTLSFSSFQEGREGTQLASFSREFRAFLQLQLVAQGNLLSDAFPISLAAYLLLHEERGLWVSNLDFPTLEAAVLDAFLRSGGEVEEIDRPGRVERHWKKGFTLALEGDRRAFRSRFLILNSPLHFFSDLMERGGKPIANGLERLRPRYIVFPCFLGIREKVVPVGMGDVLASLRDVEKPYEEGNLLFLNFSRRGDESVAPEGRRALTVQTLVPFREGAEVSLAHREAIMVHLNHLIPFLDQYLDFADFEWACEQTGRWSYPHLLYEVTGDFNWRQGIVPTRLSRGLYFVGKENFPYLGLEGEVLAGMRTAVQILQKHRRVSLLDKPTPAPL